jgi:hypothetical protein
MKDYESFVPDNYLPKEKVLNGILVNVFCVLIFIISILLFGFIYHQLWGLKFQWPPNHNAVYNIWTYIYIAILLGSGIVHEAIHGMVWSKYTDVRINVIVKSLFRLCHCENVIKVKNYIIGLIMPMLILGFIPTLIGLCFGNIIVFLFGFIMIMAGIDDIYVLFLLKKTKKAEWVKDISGKVGFIVYSQKV